MNKDLVMDNVDIRCYKHLQKAFNKILDNDIVKPLIAE